MIAWMVEALVASALLMALVLLLREPVRRAFGPGVAYALWSLPLLRLLLPPLPAAWRAAAPVPMPIAEAGERVTVLLVPDAAPVHAAAAATATATAASFPWAGALLALWGAGGLYLLLRQIVAHRRFVRRLHADADLVAVIDGVRVIASPAATGPLAFGVLRRHVAVPRDWAFDAEERELALAHELAHHARGDLIANWIALGVLALHWCNPLAWRAFHAFRADQEQATDARVLAGRSTIDALTYGRAIVRAAAGLAVSPACHLNTLTDIRRRLLMLTVARPTRRRLIAGAATALMVVAGGLGLTASGSRAAARIRDVAGVPSVPPVPPVPPVPASDAPPAPPAAPMAPMERMATMPQAAEVPAVPAVPVPPVPPVSVGGTDRDDEVSDDGQGHRTHRTIVRSRDGVDLASIPAIDVRNRRCGEGEPMVIHSGDDRHKVIVVCTDRIEKMAQRGADEAARSAGTERHAYEQALAGLRSARQRMTSNPDMPDSARREALAAIDTSIAELEQDLAKAR